MMGAGQRNIDIGVLRAFVAVAETGRMTAAAKVVNVTQSAVSQKIKRLEDLFDLRLFERRADSLQLTVEGERLISRAYRLIALNDEVVSEMRGSDFSGEVRLGVPHDVVATMMPPILRAFRRDYPNVLVTLVSDTSQALRAMMRDKAIDLALMTEPHRGGDRQFLMVDHLVWAGAKGGDASQRRPLSVALGPKPCAFRTSATDALNKAGIEWRAVCQIGSLEPVFATLQADMAVAPFLAHTIPDHLAIVSDPGLPQLPAFHINLNMPSTGLSEVAEELGRRIQDHFYRYYSSGHD